MKFEENDVSRVSLHQLKSPGIQAYFVVLFFAESPVVDFGRRSFIEWHLKDRFYERLARAWHVTNLQLMFRTRQSSGLLLKAQNAQKSEYILLEVGNIGLCALITFEVLIRSITSLHIAQ